MSSDQTISVTDTTAPSVTVPGDATVECTDDTSPSSTGTATGSDTCGDVTITFADAVLSGCGNSRTITRTWTATDACGNATSADQAIGAVDSTPPGIVVPPGAEVECTGDTTPSSTGSATGSDTCGDVTITFADSVLPGCGDGRNLTRRWTATDACGNATSDDQTISPVDTTSPSIVCPRNASVDCGGDTTPEGTGFATASDTCGAVSITHVDSDALSCGALQRAWTATDACGNASSCEQTITIGAFPGVLIAPVANARLASLLRSGDLVVGVPGARSLTIPGGRGSEASASCLPSDLPAAGSPSALPDLGDLTLDPETCKASSGLQFDPDRALPSLLVGRTISLALALRGETGADVGAASLSSILCTQGALPGTDGRLGTADDTPDPSSTPMQLPLPASVLDALPPGAAVSDLLALANDALAGLDTDGAEPAEIAAALDAVNRGFHDGRLQVPCRGRRVAER
jgi:hypothetical protein